MVQMHLRWTAAAFAAAEQQQMNLEEQQTRSWLMQQEVGRLKLLQGVLVPDPSAQLGLAPWEVLQGNMHVRNAAAAG